MSKKAVEELVLNNKIKLIDSDKYSFTCTECGKTQIKSLKQLYNCTKDFNNTCRQCNTKIHNLNKYGVENVSQLKTTKEKVKQTCLERYGVDNPSKDLGTIEKIKSTFIKNYGVGNPNKLGSVRQKIKETNLQRYGKVHALQNKEVIEKQTQTNLKRYGVENISQLDSTKEKVKQTCLERYGEKTSLLNEVVKEKIKKTNLNKYGVEHYSQSTEAAKKHRQKYSYNGISFDSSWELAYYIYCVDHGISVEVHPTTIPYTFENHQYYYQPDFLINGSDLIEIKGDQFFNENNELINPYDNSEFMKNVNLAKQKCMQENKVKVLRKSDLIPIFEYLSTTYGKSYLNQYKAKR